MEEIIYSVEVENYLEGFLKEIEEIPLPVIEKNHITFLKELLLKDLWRISDKNNILDRLSKLLPFQALIDPIKKYFQFILPELLHRFLEHANLGNEHDILLILNTIKNYLSKQMNIIGYIVPYLKSMSINPQKYIHNQSIILVYTEIIFNICYYNNNHLNEFINSSLLLTLQKSENRDLFTNRLIALFLKMTNIEQFVANEKHCIKGDSYIHNCLEKPKTEITAKSFEKSVFTGDFVPMYNILVKVCKESHTLNQKKNQFNIILTKTAMENLKSLVLGFLSGSAVLISGDIGCGKTSLIEYFGFSLGRVKPPQLLKLQLGDQMESKSLIGTYVCSDLPGEFIWQPGTLVKAMQLGSWVLLEDVDQAPTDIISMLMALVKTKRLLVPGHSKEIVAEEGFQLFITRRNATWRNENSLLGLFVKQCQQMYMKYPTKDELVEIVQRKYENISIIANKIVDIFCMVSKNNHLMSEENIVPFSTRKNTPRDLFKLCERLSKDTESCGELDNEDVFKHAVHCFDSSSSHIDDNYNVVYAMGAQLGLSKERINYHIHNYKPILKIKENYFGVGKTFLLKQKAKDLLHSATTKRFFAYTQHSLCLLEKVSLCVKNFESVLLVGDTGCGKTSVIQFLAEQCHSKLDVINMSQQTESADLFGGFKPVDICERARPVKEAFINLFKETYSNSENAKFLAHVNKCYAHKRWGILVKVMLHCCSKGFKRTQGKNEDDIVFDDMKRKWMEMEEKVKTFESKILSKEEALVFTFIEGVLVKAMKEGTWVLLDEINLATAESLEYLSGLLDFKAGSVVLSERGDIQELERHKNFRIFACMNPATDIGKKELPISIRNRFTEIYVDEMNNEGDLKTLVNCYLKEMNLNSAVLDGIIRFYLLVRQQAKEKLVDGSGNRPLYSLRTLCRGLEYAGKQLNMPPIKAVFEGLRMSFLTQLDKPSSVLVEKMIHKHVLEFVKNVKALLNSSSERYMPNKINSINVEGYWIEIGSKTAERDESYVITKSVTENLKNLARVVAGRYPVLLQGETSVGKTSLITYLAKLTGNECVRVNNHEHTDIQEYIGCYAPDDNGNLVFKEGVLVTAMRYGHWLILDELNLAPSDVLEALNRVLDDNRELFIPETQEVVKAHPKFILFATQNPPGHYGGRKMLSRAFRNRFVELHLDQIPSKELEQILHLRCHLPQSYCKKFVQVMLDLQVRRRNSGIFEGKHGFMTLRDLFRWAERYRHSSGTNEGFYDWEQCICEDGYMLIAGRCRKDDETRTIKEVLELNFKRKVNLDQLFHGAALSSKHILEKVMSSSTEAFDHLVWTNSMKRLAVLVARALQFNEAVLLVGETGCGKTTICQLLTAIRKSNLYAVNCHMHTEAADFLGGLRPVRSKDPNDNRLFEWKDGPLITSMIQGDVFLIDEISLADDSVLERINSVLEPERTLVLSEKGDVEKAGGGGRVDIIKAKGTFCLLATMNPGGDYGKKELSPALRNRFTEIWCSPSEDDEDLKNIIEHNISPGVKLHCSTTTGSGIGKCMVEFINWYKDTEVGVRCTISIRDLLSWVQFINASLKKSQNYDVNKHLTVEETYVHGACLVFIDAIGSGNTAFSRSQSADSMKHKCVSYLCRQVKLNEFQMSNDMYTNSDSCFGIQPFFIKKGSQMTTKEEGKYNFDCQTTRKNVTRVLRGLQLYKPILLEGSPGVGKTSLVIALAQMSGHPITRINLSEETDISDLFGADLPGEGNESGQFLWRDGPFLSALKAGHWVVFDELNLASQSVLEGLNACFDHRAEIFVPELNRTFHVEKNTRIFACQNPLNEGGGRKGLPKSFLNRFTKVFIDALTPSDLCQIMKSLFPDLNEQCVENMVVFNEKINTNIINGDWGKRGGPWQFNVRDMTRWCQLVRQHSDQDAGDFTRLLYQDRMRSLQDKEKMIVLYQETCGNDALRCKQMTQQCNFKITPNHIKVGYSSLSRRKTFHKVSNKQLEILRCQLPLLESLMKCIEMNWMALLIGSESCGKNTLVEILSTLTGNALKVMCCNSSTDSTDLIGSFEQLKKSSKILQSCNELKCCVNGLVEERINQAQGHNIYLDSVQDLTHLRAALDNLTEDSLDNEEYKRNLITVLESFLKYISSLDQPNENYIGILNKCNNLLSQLSDKQKELGGHFEWVDGILVSALKNGDWLLLKNVNFCSASLLDRLNGLLEPGGVLALDERGVVKGEIVAIKPHPNFRLFLSMDPKFGEVSRAMRNRGVEIFFPSKSDGGTVDDLDMKMLIRSAGIEDEKLSTIFVNIYKSFSTLTEYQVTWPTLIQCCQITSKLLENNWHPMVAILDSVLETFGHFMKDELVPEGKEKIEILTEMFQDTFHSTAIGHMEILNKIPTAQEWLHYPASSLLMWNLIPVAMVATQDSKEEKSDILESSVALYIERLNVTELFKGVEFLRRDFESIEENLDKKCFIDRLSICLDLFSKQVQWDELKRDCSISELLNCSQAQEEGRLLACRFMLLLLLCLHGLTPEVITKVKQGSMIYFSHQFQAGRIRSSVLPHISLRYLHKCLSVLILEFFEKWLQQVTVSTVEEIAIILSGFDWLHCLLDHVSEPLLVDIQGNVDFSLSKLSQHWKWFYERFLIPVSRLYHLETSEMMKVELGDELGENEQYYQFHRMTAKLCKPLTLKNLKQANVIRELNNLYQVAFQKENVELLRKGVLEAWEAVLITDTSNDAIQDKIENVKAEISKAASRERDDIELERNIRMVYQCLQNNLLLELFEQGEAKGLKNELCTVEMEKLLFLMTKHFESCHCVPHMKMMMSASRNRNDDTTLERLSPHLKSALYASRFPNCISFFQASEDKKISNAVIPLSWPFLAIVQKMSTSKESQTLPQIPLKNMDVYKVNLQELFCHLWESPFVFGSLNFRSNILSSSLRKLMRVLVLLVEEEEGNFTQIVASSNKEIDSTVYLDMIQKAKSKCGLSKTQRCMEEILSRLEQLFQDVKITKEEWYSPMLLVLTSLLEYQIVRPHLKYDTVEEMMCRKAHLQAQLFKTDNELKLRYDAENVWCGVSTINISEDLSPSYEHLTSNPFMVNVHLHKRKTILEELQNIQIEEVVRPEKNEYDAIREEFILYEKTVGDDRKILSMIDDISLQRSTNKNMGSTYDSGSGSIIEMKSLAHKLEAWTHSTNQFIKKISAHVFYQDVVVPSANALKSIQTGFLMLSTILQGKIESHQFLSCMATSELNMSHPRVLFEYLSNSVWQTPSVTLKILLHQKQIQCSSYLSSQYPTELKDFYPSLLTLSVVILQRYFFANRCAIDGFLTDRRNSFGYLTQVLKMCYQVWCEKKETEKQEQIQRESMYKYKSKVHCETEDDELDIMVQSLFPKFEDEFTDVVKKDNLNNDPTTTHVTKHARKNIEKCEIPTLDEVVVFDIIRSIHFGCPPIEVLSTRDTVTRSFELINRLCRVEDISACLPRNESLCPLLLLVTSNLLKDLHDTKPIDLETFNVYEDYNIQEAVEAKVTVLKMKVFVQTLLEEFENHPALLQIIKIIDRIVEFGVAVPLMKLVAGFELLLKECQDWESYAASHVSLKSHLEEITHRVIQWRRLELRTWSTLLKRTEENHVKSASKWFFHFYNLLQSAIETKDDSDYISASKELLENASVGDFHTRLTLIETLSLHIKENEFSRDLENVTLSILSYYKQFEGRVTNYLEEGKKPIQKELLDYIKIAKWNDNNYYSIKIAAEKSHRNLTKFVYKFEALLKEPVHQFLRDPKLVSKLTSPENKTFRYVRKQNSNFNLTDNTHLENQSELYLNKTVQLSKRMRGHVKELIENRAYGNVVEGLDEFAGDVVETIHNLQNQSFTLIPKEKRKEVINNMQQLKRKKLAGLFKYLKEIGLSFHKGDVLPKEVDILRLPTPSYLSGSETSEASGALKTCHRYFFQALARQAVFEDSMCSPSKDMGPTTISHFKGVTAHLMYIACQQRISLEKLIQGHTKIRLFSNGLEKIYATTRDGMIVPHQKTIRIWMARVYDIFSESLTTLTYVKDILSSSPTLHTNLPQSMSMENINYDISEAADSSFGIEAVKITENLLHKVRHLCDSVDVQQHKEKEFPLHTWSQWSFVEDSIKTVREMCNSTNKILEFCCQKRNSVLNPSRSPIMKPLVDLQKKWTVFLEEFHLIDIEEKTRNSQGIECPEAVDLSENVVKKVMFAIQKLTNLHDDFEKKHCVDRCEKREVENSLSKGQLHPLLTTTYTVHLDLLGIQEIAELCQLCLRKMESPSPEIMLRQTSPEKLPFSSVSCLTDSQSTNTASLNSNVTSSNVDEVTDIISPTTKFSTSGISPLACYLNLIPVLREFLELTEFYVFNTIMLHRTTCKMLSILYDLFTTLLKEGFCRPPEEVECKSREGVTEFEDVTGGGLGEGEGAKDVSDQIESQDQVEETLHENSKDTANEEEEKEENVEEEKNAIEMDDDFEGNLESMQLNDSDQEENDKDQEDDGEDEMDKQMGQVDDQEDEELDKNMWDDNEEEEKQPEEENTEDEKNDDTEDDGKSNAKDWQMEMDLTAKDEDLGNGIDKQDEKEQSDSPPTQQEEFQDDIINEQDQQKEQDSKQEAGNEADKAEEDDFEMGDLKDDDEEKEERNDEDTPEDDKKADGEDQHSEDLSEGQIEEQLQQDQGETSDDEDDHSQIPPKTNLSQDLSVEESIESTKAVGGGRTTSREQNKQDDMTGFESQENSTDDKDNKGDYNQRYDAKKQPTGQKGQKRKEFQKSNEEKTLNKDEYPKDVKKRRALDASDEQNKADNKEDDTKAVDEEQDNTYQHVNDEEMLYDDLTVDAISKEQMKELNSMQGVSVTREEDDSAEDENNGGEHVEKMEVDGNDANESKLKLEEKPNKQTEINVDDDKEHEDDLTKTNSEDRDNESNSKDEIKSDFFTNYQLLVHGDISMKERDAYIQSLRKELEMSLAVLPSSRVDNKDMFDYVTMWMKYDQMTSNLSMQLCEQLRLVIEPTQANKLKGDYRTGKRLNMRKIIPYIASQFQKDKIWLRRTKKSKRNYQIILAVDDSSSMMDNHLKQLAFESIVVISNGLKLLEAGDLAVISFGEDSELVHPFQETFNEQVGASIIKKFTFEQKKTRVAHLMKYCTLLFQQQLRSYARGGAGHSPISQLLLIISDGRGIYLEGKETVLKSVSQAREMGIFTVFLVLDDPSSQNSILDIKVPVFKPGVCIPEIKSYIEDFPFPFYVLLRDINSLPHVLSDALKQWFELVTT